MEIRFVGVKKEQCILKAFHVDPMSGHMHGSEANFEQDQRAVHLAWNG